jgi:hypothetical protein
MTFADAAAAAAGTGGSFVGCMPAILYCILFCYNILYHIISVYAILYYIML